MHDIVIRGGTIVDGTGKAPFSGDVAIAGGRIAAVGGKLGPGKREIDAAGLMVTPGWVDVHTHYDGQAMWDPLLTPSCWHGVTTVMFGNCGVGFAPVKKEHRGALMDLMEGVEEIPNPVLAAGLNWEWETFPQFMDELERRPRAIDICAQAAHLPTRVYVMGDRALRREPATPDDIAEMRKLTVEALRAGAFGFTTSRTDSHKTPDGELVPSRDADDYELLGIGQALGITGTGAFGMNSDFDDEEFELRWIRKQARETGRPVWFLLTDRYSDPQRWRRLIKAVHGMRAEGLPVTAQMAGRPIGVMMGIGTALNPFTVRPSYKKLESLPIEEQRRRLRDPEVREQVLKNLERYVVKPTGASGGYGVVIGPKSSENELAKVRELIVADPSAFIAQPVIQLSMHPTIVGNGSHSGSEIAPRHIDFRPFVLLGAKPRVLAGGLTRVALREGSLIVNSSQGGGSKDTWVLEA